MNKAYVFLGVGLAVIAGLAAVFVLVPKQPESVEIDSLAPVSIPAPVTTETTPSDSQATQTGAGEYLAYNPSLLSRADNGRVVMFFHAPWCPTCRALERDITANLGNIPSDVTILKTDYDTQTELKRKYGVTYQHTLVQVDSNGEQITKFSGSPTLESLVGSLR